MWRQSLLALAVLGVIVQASAESQQTLAPLEDDKKEGVIEKTFEGIKHEAAKQSRQESEIAEDTVHTLLRRHKEDHHERAETGATGAHGVASSALGSAAGGSAASDQAPSAAEEDSLAGKGPEAAAGDAGSKASKQEEAHASASATRLAAFEEDSEQAEARNAGR